MIKIIGATLVLLGAGGFGLSKALLFYHQFHQLREFLGAVEILKCELNYTLSPLPVLCERTAERTRGACSRFFRIYAEKLDKIGARSRAAAAAMEETKGLSLPPDGKMAVLELLSSLGRYDLDGENRLLQLTGQRLRSALERLEKDKKPMARGYAVLGVTTGIALVILFI